MTYRPAQIRKALVALVTLATQALAYNLVPEVAVPYVLLVVGVLGSYGVFAVRNDTRGGRA